MSDDSTHFVDKALQKADFDDEKKKLQEVEAPIRAAASRESSGQKEYDRSASDIRKYLSMDGDDYDVFMSEKTLAQNSQRRAARYMLLADDPYFYHIDLRKSSGEIESFVVGKQGLMLDGQQIVVDWRTPMGGLYARKQERNYEVNGKKYTLLLRRAASIKKGVLQNIDTEYDASMRELPGEVVDPFLVQVLLDKRRDYTLSDIIATIQETQNEIMRQPPGKSFIVQGCAGSGKTMILLHRLSYLIYNNGSSDADLERYAVITPGDFFDRHIDELSAQLDVDKIRRFTLAGFYNYLSGTLAGADTYQEERDGKTVTRRKVPVPQGVNPTEADLDHSLLRDIYSNRFTTSIYETIDTEKKDVLSLLEEEGLLSYFAEHKMSSPSVRDTPFAIYTLLNRNLKRMEDTSSSDHEALNNASRSLAEAIRDLAAIKSRVEAINERYSSARNDVASALMTALTSAEASLPAVISETRSDGNSVGEVSYLQELSNALDDGDIALPMYPHALHNEALSEALNRYVDNITSFTSAEMSLLTSQSSRVNLYQRRVDERAAAVERAKEALEANPNHRLADALRECIQFLDARQFWTLAEDKVAEIYKRHGVKYVPRRNYPHRAFAILAFCTRYYGTARVGLRLVCIDEAQDISPAEYEVLSATLGSGVTFNLYGDIGQLVTDYRGVEDWDKIPQAFGRSVYQLNQNYRNTIEITDYCNRSFGKDMTGIGLTGARVRHATPRFAAEALKKLRDAHQAMRIAVIYKGDIAPVKAEIEQALAGEVKWEKPTESDVAVLSVTQSKGLEFDGVLVIEDDMSQNELYVAYTRALDNLFTSSLRMTARDADKSSRAIAPGPSEANRIASNAQRGKQGNWDADAGVSTQGQEKVRIILLARTLFSKRKISGRTRNLAMDFAKSLAVQQNGKDPINDSISIAKGQLKKSPEKCNGLDLEELFDGWEYDKAKTRIIIGCLIDHAIEIVAQQEASERADHATTQTLPRPTEAKPKTSGAAVTNGNKHAANHTTPEHGSRKLSQPGSVNVQSIIETAGKSRHAPRAVVEKTSSILASLDPHTKKLRGKRKKTYRSGIYSAVIDYIQHHLDKYPGATYGRYARKLFLDGSIKYLFNWKSSSDCTMLLCLVIIDILLDYGLTSLDNK